MWGPGVTKLNGIQAGSPAGLPRHRGAVCRPFVSRSRTVEAMCTESPGIAPVFAFMMMCMCTSGHQAA